MINKYLLEFIWPEGSVMIGVNDPGSVVYIMACVTLIYYLCEQLYYHSFCS